MGAVAGVDAVGGLVGWNNHNISQCSAGGQVSGVGTVGGLIGYNDGTVGDCYATSTTTGDTTVGGLIACNESRGTVSSSYAVGAVTGKADTGGLLGIHYGTVDNSFWNTETSGQSSSAGGTGKTTAEMKNSATFTDTDTSGLDNPWDISSVWFMDIPNNNGYPNLKWTLHSFSLTVQATMARLRSSRQAAYQSGSSGIPDPCS